MKLIDIDVTADRRGHWYCKGKGGVYKILSTSYGAGTCRGQIHVTYQDTRNGEIYHRTRIDFIERMAKYPDDANGELERTP